MPKRNGKAKGKAKKKANGSNEVVVVGANFRAKARSYVKRLSECEGRLDDEKATFMRKCQPIKADMTEIYSEAKGEGLSTKALKAEMKIRRLEKQKDKTREALQPEDQNELDRIRIALGELDGTPLGDAAMASAGNSNGASEAHVS